MVVLGACELLLAGDLPERSRRRAERIQRAAEEMQALVDTFLLLARARPDQQEVFGGSAGRLTWPASRASAGATDAGKGTGVRGGARRR